MKKLFPLLCISFIIACGSDSSDKKLDSAASVSSTEKTTTPSGKPTGISQEDYDKALNLLTQSDCLTCHEISSEKTGPPYQEVANKYESTESNIGMLAHKIIKGGSGNWGQVPMTPHAKLSVEDAKVMVRYILALKKANN